MTSTRCRWVNHCCLCFSTTAQFKTEADTRFLERGFIYIKVWGFALLILSHFSQISHENDRIFKIKGGEGVRVIRPAKASCHNFKNMQAFLKIWHSKTSSVVQDYLVGPSCSYIIDDPFCDDLITEAVSSRSKRFVNFRE